MKKNYFLISIFAILLIPNLMSSFNIVTNSKTDEIIGDLEPLNINSDNYLSLSYQNGTFYAWDQTDNTEAHIIGIFNTADQSYLLDNFGVFWSLEYQISKFYRITDQYGIAQIEYFQDENENSYINKYFIVKLENNKVIVTSSAILSENFNFTVLNQNYIVASGLGLDLIQINDQGALVGDIKTLIPPYDKGGYALTSFYAIDESSGIFIGDDQFFYLLKNITNTMIRTQINLKAPIKSGDNVITINASNVVIRNADNNLYFVNISQENNIIINEWKDENDKNIKSKTKNIAFAVSDDTFILNTTVVNSGSEYGTPYLIKTSDWNNLIAIPNIKSINNFIFTNKDENTGIFVDKNLNVNSFVYENDNFTVNIFGNLNNFQFVNKNLVFGSFQGNNLLITPESNKLWAAMKSVTFTTNSSEIDDNLLNNMISTEDTLVNYQNAYIANGSARINVTDEKLKQVTIESSTGKRILEPAKNSNNVSYDFSNFDKYQVIIDFFSDNIAYQLIYQVNIVNFTKQNLLQITSSGSNISSYVGASKNDVLYDIKVTTKQDVFTISGYDYRYLQYVELSVYGDTKDMVVKNVYNFQNNSEIKIDTNEPDLFYGLKIVNLINQISWIYLGFSNDGINPMTNFWDTERGQILMHQALMHKYLERDLRTMNTQKIEELMNVSINWQSIAIQGKTIIIAIISVFGISILTIIGSIIYNAYLNRRIAIDQVEQNRIFKNTIDL